MRSYYDNTFFDWNPWHGCTKISPGCAHCYVYRQDEMYGSAKSSIKASLNGDFGLPIRKKRDKSWKIPSGAMVMTCFTSDFLLEDADRWREEAWEMMKIRNDCTFYFFTKRITRLPSVLPADWGDGYDNVIIGCTAENQEMADRRLPEFIKMPIRHKTIILAPLLGPIDITAYLDSGIEEVSVGGESGTQARICDYAWVLDIRRQCIEHNVPFRFHQTGARFVKDGKLYRIRRGYQLEQAAKAGINFRIGPDMKPYQANARHDIMADVNI